MSLFDVDLDTIDTDVFKLRYNASSATAYKGYDMVKIRVRKGGYFTSYYHKKYLVVYSIEENKIYIITIIDHNVQEKEMKFNNLYAFDIDCIIQQYIDKLLNEAKLQEPDREHDIEFY